MKSFELHDLEYAQKLINKVVVSLREFRKECSREELQYIDHLIYLIEGNGSGGALMYLNRLHDNLTTPYIKEEVKKEEVKSEKPIKCFAPGICCGPGTLGPYTGG